MSLAQSRTVSPHHAIDPARRLADALIDRTRGLFGLLVVASGSRRAAQRLCGTDEGTLDAPRSVPSVDLVSRLGLALGLDSRASLGIVGSVASTRRTPAELRRDLECADLHDDAAELERIAVQLGSHPDRPGDVGLAQLVLARASISRGDAAAARNAVDLALAIGIEANDAGLAGNLGEAIACESRLGEPWSGQRTRIRGADHLAWVASCSSEPDGCAIRGPRRRAWHLATQWIEGRIGTVDAVPSLHREIERAVDPRALGWCASIAAMAALSAPSDRITLRLAVSAQLAIDEAIDASHGSTRDLLVARRARVTLREWGLRHRAGEAELAVIDPTDDAELTCARLRLSVEGGPRHFFHSSNSTLDASSGGGWMRGLVPTLHAMGAVAASRSEDPC